MRYSGPLFSETPIFAREGRADRAVDEAGWPLEALLTPQKVF